MLPQVAIRNGNDSQGGREAAQVGDHELAQRCLSGPCMILLNGIEVMPERWRAIGLDCRNGKDADVDRMFGVTCVSDYDQGG